MKQTTLFAIPSTSSAPAAPISLAESSTGLTQESISSLNQAILTFFNVVRVMIEVGIFNTTTGGEAISTDKRIGRLPKRIFALREYIKGNPLLEADLVTLTAFINAFHAGGSSSFLASWTRTEVMKHFAELMQNLNAAVEANNDSNNNEFRILTLLETWMNNLFANVLATTKDQLSSDASIQTSNQASEQQLAHIREATTPVRLTFAHLTQCDQLIHAIAIALAMNYPIRSLALINCDLDHEVLRVLVRGIKFNRTLEHLGFYDSPLGGFGYMRIHEAVKNHHTLKSLHLIKVKPEAFAEFPLDSVPLSPNLEILRVENNGGFDPDCFAVRSIEEQSNSMEQPGKLRYLSLAKCGLGVRVLAKVLSSVLYQNLSIETLDLSKNGALPIYGGYDNLRRLFITWGTPSKLKRLDLSSLIFDTEALTIILEMTTRTAAGQVSYLNLSSCNIDENLLKTLIDTLATTASTSPQSSTMPASSSSDQSPHGTYILPSSSLRTLVLANNPIGDKGALRLVSAILDGRLPITDLDLSHCGITNKGAAMIQLASQEKRAEVRRSPLDYVDEVAIKEIVPLPLQVLILEGNDIQQTTLDAINAAINGSELLRPSSPSQHYSTKYGSQTWQVGDSKAQEQGEDPELLHGFQSGP